MDGVKPSESRSPARRLTLYREVKEEKWTFGIRPLWVKMFLTGVLLIAASFSVAPVVAVGGFLVGIAVALWR